MSHIAVQKSKPGSPMFKDITALTNACQMLGLEIEVRSKFTWFNRHVGDYPMPDGMTKEELGNNAKFVLKLNAASRAKYSRGQTPYEIGILEDPNNPGCYIPMYDFWQGGYGVDSVVGAPIMGEDGEVLQLCPKLKQYYDMACDVLTAKEVGDVIELMTLKDAYRNHPELRLPASVANNTDDWVSIARTENRVRTTR